MCEILLEFGADINIKDNDKKTALDYAKIMGFYTIIELLIFTDLGATKSEEIKKICFLMNNQNAIINILLNKLNKNLINIINIIIECINEKKPISDDLLMLFFFHIQKIL